MAETKGVSVLGQNVLTRISLNYKGLDCKPGTAAKKGARLSTMYQKPNGLAMITENIAKTYIVEIKTVSLLSVTKVTEKNPAKMAVRSRNVVENKCRKNVAFLPLHYIDENKTRYIVLSIMLMKRKRVVRRDKAAGSRG